MQSGPELSPELLSIIAEEEQILEKVLLTIQEYKQNRVENSESFRERFEQIRSELAVAQESDLAHLSQQVTNLRAIASRGKPNPVPDSVSPYFAHMVIQELVSKKTRHMLMGYTGFMESADYPIVDWRHAPVARIFFSYREHEDFEEELPGRVLHGILMARRIVDIRSGQLIEISGSFGVIRREILKDGSKGPWTLLSRILALKGGAQSAVRGSSLSFERISHEGPSGAISSLLDATQYDLLTADPDTPILVSGNAGSGKTTVAIHRLAYLMHDNPKRFNKRSMIVVLPTQGLLGLYKNLMNSLKIPDFRVSMFEDWVEGIARRVVKGMPKKVDDDAPPSVIEFKRSHAVLEMMQNYLQSMTDRLCRELSQKTTGFSADLRHQVNWQGPWFDAATALVALVDQKSPIQFEQSAAKKILQRWQERYEDFWSCFVEMITDAELCKNIDAEHALNSSKISSIVSYLGSIYLPSKLDIKLDVEDFKTAEGQSLDEYLGEQEQEKLHPEDFSLCLLLWHKVFGQAGVQWQHVPKYEHLFIDEVQEFAPAELGVLKLCAREGSGFTICGDFFQKINKTGLSDGWNDVVRLLSVKGHRASFLNTNYRSPRQIAEVAWDIAQVPMERRPRSIREGGPVLYSAFPSFSLAMMSLIDRLMQLLDAEPLASIVVISHSQEHAKQVYKSLEIIPEVRDAIRGDFKFRPGIDVTCVAEVKGLEFDYVIIPDADIQNYPDQRWARHALHLAMTRAMHQVWLFHIGTASPVLPATLMNS